MHIQKDPNLIESMMGLRPKLGNLKYSDFSSLMRGSALSEMYSFEIYFCHLTVGM